MRRIIADDLLVGGISLMLGFVAMLFMQAIWRWGIGPGSISIAMYIFVSTIAVVLAVVGTAHVVVASHTMARASMLERMYARRPPRPSKSTAADAIVFVV